MNDRHQSENFRKFLRQAYQSRLTADNRYTMRDFAKLLGLDYTTLSKIVRGRRTLSAKLIEKLGDRLGLNETEISSFKRIAQQQKTAGLESKYSYSVIDLDQFQVVADWQHFAILELLSIKSFRPDIHWVAETLGLTEKVVSESVERLTKAGMLEVTKTRWIDRTAGKTTNIGQAPYSVAHKSLQRQFLQKALTALDEVPLDLRDQTAMTIAIDSRKLPEAKKRITKFRRSLTNFLSLQSPSKDIVYNLNISLFPISKNQKPRRNL